MEGKLPYVRFFYQIMHLQFQHMLIFFLVLEEEAESPRVAVEDARPEVREVR